MDTFSVTLTYVLTVNINLGPSLGDFKRAREVLGTLYDHADKSMLATTPNHPKLFDPGHDLYEHHQLHGRHYHKSYVKATKGSISAFENRLILAAILTAHYAIRPGHYGPRNFKAFLMNLPHGKTSFFLFL